MPRDEANLYAGQVLVESLSKWPWNECPSQRGIAVQVRGIRSLAVAMSDAGVFWLFLMKPWSRTMSEPTTVNRARAMVSPRSILTSQSPVFSLCTTGITA